MISLFKKTLPSGVNRHAIDCCQFQKPKKVIKRFRDAGIKKYCGDRQPDIGKYKIKDPEPPETACG
jgi:hypothetical protein